MFVGIRGSLTMFPSVRRAWDNNELTEDAFSLIVKRSVSLGLVDLGGVITDCPQWSHADAGGDWEPGGHDRLLGWLQAYVRPPHGQATRRLPINPAVDVIRAALSRVGTVTINEIDALLPLLATRRDPSPIANGRDWFGSPEAPKAPTVVGVVLDWDENADAVTKAAEIVNVANEIVGDVITARLAAGAEKPALMSKRRPFAGRTPSTRATVICTLAPEWSSDFAAWLAELFAYASLACHAGPEVLVRVSRTPWAQ